MLRFENETYWQTGTLFDDSVDHLTEVGAYSSATSHYGLADTEGLLYQWTEGSRLAYEKNFPVYRGGAWYYDSDSSGAGHRNLYSFPYAASYHWFGLRLASPAPPGLAGDYNDDGAVDAADYTIFQDNLGLDAAVLGGNGSGAATVVGADYLLWKDQFGQSIATGSGANTIPEPATGWLLLLTATLTYCRRPYRDRLTSCRPWLHRQLAIPGERATARASAAISSAEFRFGQTAVGFNRHQRPAWLGLQHTLKYSKSELPFFVFCATKLTTKIATKITTKIQDPSWLLQQKVSLPFFPP